MRHFIILYSLFISIISFGQTEYESFDFNQDKSVLKKAKIKEVQVYSSPTKKKTDLLASIKYDDQGQTTYQARKIIENEITSYYNFTYDENGMKSTSDFVDLHIDKNSIDSTVNQIKYQYDSRGNRLAIESFDDKNYLQFYAYQSFNEFNDVIVRYSKDSIFELSYDTLYFDYEYIDTLKSIEYCYHDSSRTQLKSRYEFKYNSNGLVVEERAYKYGEAFSENGNLYYIFSTEYFSNGDVKKNCVTSYFNYYLKKWSHKKAFYEKYEVIFDQHGEVTAEIEYDFKDRILDKNTWEIEYYSSGLVRTKKDGNGYIANYEYTFY